MSGELKPTTGNEEPKTQGIFSKMGDMAKGAVKSAKSGLHNASVFTSRISARQIKDKINVYVKEGIHNSVKDGLDAREDYLQKVQADINSKEHDTAVFDKYISKTMGVYKINWPLPNEESGIKLDPKYVKVTKLEHLGTFTTSLSVDKDSREEVRNVFAVNALKKLIGDLQKEIVDQEEAATNDEIVIEEKEAKIASKAAAAKDAADTAITESKKGLNTNLSGEKQRLTTLLQKRNYLPGLFLTFDRENTPTLYYYDYSENSSEYETKLLNKLFPTEKQGDSIKRVNITKDNTDAIWAILLANQIGQGEDKKDVNTEFDPGFNTNKPTFKEVKFNTSQEPPPPAAGGDGEAPTETPAPAPAPASSGIENLKKYQAKFHSIETHLRDEKTTEGMEDANRDTMWNMACYASQTGWLISDNKQETLITLLLSENEMKAAWANRKWTPEGEKVDSNLETTWSGSLDKINFCGFLGKTADNTDVFILQNGLIKVLKDGSSEYKINTISGPEDLKLTFEKGKVFGWFGGKRRRKSHRKSHKKTQKKHKKQMKKSHKKVHKKKTRGKKC